MLSSGVFSRLTQIFWRLLSSLECQFPVSSCDLFEGSIRDLSTYSRLLFALFLAQRFELFLFPAGLATYLDLSSVPSIRWQPSDRAHLLELSTRLALRFSFIAILLGTHSIVRTSPLELCEYFPTLFESYIFFLCFKVRRTCPLTNDRRFSRSAKGCSGVSDLHWNWLFSLFCPASCAFSLSFERSPLLARWS